MTRIGPREAGPVGLTPRLSVDQLLWVANTQHGPGGHWFARVAEDTGDHDHLLEPGAAVEYLDRHHVPLPAEPPTAHQLESLAAIRSMIRDLLASDGPTWTPAVVVILGSTRFAVDGRSSILADGRGWDAFIGDLMLPLLELVGRRADLRMCGNPHCRLVFLDLSKNHSRRWCDTTGCGNRSRVARYRRRRSGSDAAKTRSEPPVTYGPNL
jgi:hypothetical protein